MLPYQSQMAVLTRHQFHPPRLLSNSNWDSAQTVTVTGSDDDIIDGSQTSTITISVVDEISDNAYGSVATRLVCNNS